MYVYSAGFFTPYARMTLTAVAIFFLNLLSTAFRSMYYCNSFFNNYGCPGSGLMSQVVERKTRVNHSENALVFSQAYHPATISLLDFFNNYPGRFRRTTFLNRSTFPSGCSSLILSVRIACHAFRWHKDFSSLRPFSIVHNSHPFAYMLRGNPDWNFSAASVRLLFYLK